MATGGFNFGGEGGGAFNFSTPEAARAELSGFNFRGGAGGGATASEATGTASEALVFSVTAANVRYDLAKDMLVTGEGPLGWAWNKSTFPQTADLTLTGGAARVTKLHLTSWGVPNENTVKNCRLDYKDPSGSWRSGTTFQSSQTMSRQSFDITSGVATTEWRVVVVDTHGGYSSIAKIELEGIRGGGSGGGGGTGAFIFGGAPAPVNSASKAVTSPGSSAVTAGDGGQARWEVLGTQGAGARRRFLVRILFRELSAQEIEQRRTAKEAARLVGSWDMFARVHGEDYIRQAGPDSSTYKVIISRDGGGSLIMKGTGSWEFSGSVTRTTSGQWQIKQSFSTGDPVSNLLLATLDASGSRFSGTWNRLGASSKSGDFYATKINDSTFAVAPKTHNRPPPDFHTTPRSIIGCRVRVLWSRGKKYDGVVSQYDLNDGKHYIQVYPPSPPSSPSPLLYYLALHCPTFLARGDADVANAMALPW